MYSSLFFLVLVTVTISLSMHVRNFKRIGKNLMKTSVEVVRSASYGSIMQTLLSYKTEDRLTLDLSSEQLNFLDYLSKFYSSFATQLNKVLFEYAFLVY